MVQLKINGIPIELPYQPYAPQLVTISQLLGSFQNGTSCLVESPTGTGKSLSIICSVLAYNAYVKKDVQRDDEERRPYRVIICSRTHKQLEQLVRQLKQTVYSPRVVILGSRSQYCINPRLKEIEDKNSGCSELVKEGKCSYFNGKERLAKKIGDKLLDIEELRKEGKQCGGCPYFASRILARDADVIFAPYNYMFDAKVRDTVDVSLARSIVIIDEAHNLEDVCRAAGSLEFTSNTVEYITNDLLGAVKKSAFLGTVKADFLSLLDLLRRLREYAEKIIRNEKMLIKKGPEVLTELEKMGMKREVVAIIKSSIGNIAGDEEARDFLNLNTTRFIEDLEKVLELIFEGCDAYALCFESKTGGKYLFNIWLLDPSIVFRRLAREVWSISLLSGTLTPFSSFGSELGFKFTNSVIAPHILQPEQVFVASVRCGYLGEPLCGTFSNADSLTYINQIAHIVSDVSDRLKFHGGVLVFVPSYAFLTKLASKIPGAYVEPRSGGNTEFERILKRYNMNVDARRRSVLLCVFRGKAAEGTDFKDAYARAVISVGIPYPSLKDPNVALKKEYNDKKGGFNGRMWYETQAFRAINQGLGRVVRHSRDWGALFLLDSRFSERRYQSHLPQWCTKNLKAYEKYTDALPGLKKLLDLHEMKKTV